MLAKRKEQGFNLSFLDVMACGLGAVILILILVRFQDNTDIPSDELNRLQEELAALQDQDLKLTQSLSEEASKTAAKTATLETLKQRIATLKIQQNATTAALQDKLAVIADLENAIAALAPETSNDPIQTAGTQEEQYLLGLKVEGQRIGILLDSSASMSEEALIEIIKRKVGTEAERQAGAKWQRTIKTAQWLLARLPSEAEFSVVSFNRDADTLGRKSRMQAADTDDLQSVFQDLASLAPNHGTNLLRGLEEMNKALPNMTHLYIVTDGLPTLLESSARFQSSRGCKPVEGEQATISSECRVKVFAHTIRSSPVQGVVTNIILLPLEGDPEAPSAYWSWASRTQGTFLAPARSWP